MGRLLVFALLAAAVAWVVWIARGETLFRIRVRRQGIEIQGRIPGRSEADVRELVRELSLPVGASVRGVPDRDGFRLTAFRKIPDNAAQKLRNYLYLKRAG